MTGWQRLVIRCRHQCQRHNDEHDNYSSFIIVAIPTIPSHPIPTCHRCCCCHRQHHHDNKRDDNYSCRACSVLVTARWRAGTRLVVCCSCRPCNFIPPCHRCCCCHHQRCPGHAFFVFGVPLFYPQPVPHVLPVFFGIGMPNCSSKTRRRFSGDTPPIDIVNIGHVPPVQHILLVAIVHGSDFLCCKPAKSMHYFQVNLIRGIGFANTQHWALGSSHTLHSVATEECIQRRLIHHTLSLKLEWCLLSLAPPIVMSLLWCKSLGCWVVVKVGNIQS